MFCQDGCGSQETSDNSGSLDDAEEVEVSLAEGYEYIGCFRDKYPISERDMSLTTKKEFPQNKPKMCARRCAKEAGATFFGLQNGGL